MNSTNSFVVTVGLCVKNAEATVTKAIRSIVNQDFPHKSLELLVIEGFSQDQTLSLVKKDLSGVDFDFTILRDNKGLGAARQIVVSKARGVYIVWVDADMVLPDDYVRKQVDFMQLNPSVAIAAGKYGLHQGQGLVADLENLVYAVDSVYGEKKNTKFGYLPGAEGAIYRVEAVRQVGGFDMNIKGAAEDTELDYRLIASGWELGKTDTFFVESTRPSLFSLWNQYFWYGRGGHFIYHKDVSALSLLKMTPFAGFVAGLIRCPNAYALTHKKMVFLLPLHYSFKRIAWLLGFFSAHLGGYGHFKAN
jgi:glycosyltransferase involved in cell wall biosynthesis